MRRPLQSASFIPESPEVIRMRFLEAQKHGTIELLTPLPRKVRHRLWRERLLTRIGIWFIEHRMHRPAIALWRLFGMWRRTSGWW